MKDLKLDIYVKQYIEEKLKNHIEFIHFRPDECIVNEDFINGFKEGYLEGLNDLISQIFKT